MSKDFEKLLDEHGQRVLTLAMRVLGNAEFAKDAHQEVFLAIWSRWHKFNGQINWPAYLYRVTVRKSMDIVRRNRKMSRFLEKQQNCRDLRISNPADENLKMLELQKQLSGAIAKLPKRQAEIFVLAKLEGLKNEKIAEVLGCSQNTVRVHLHRAIKKLAHQFSDYLE